MDDEENFHSFCRLLGSLKLSFNLEEVVSTEAYSEWVAGLLVFSKKSFAAWNTVHDAPLGYVMALWGAGELGVLCSLFGAVDGGDVAVHTRRDLGRGATFRGAGLGFSSAFGFGSRFASAGLGCGSGSDEGAGAGSGSGAAGSAANRFGGAGGLGGGGAFTFCVGGGTGFGTGVGSGVSVANTISTSITRSSITTLWLVEGNPYNAKTKTTIWKPNEITNGTRIKALRQRRLF